MAMWCNGCSWTRQHRVNLNITGFIYEISTSLHDLFLALISISKGMCRPSYSFCTRVQHRSSFLLKRDNLIDMKLTNPSFQITKNIWEDFSAREYLNDYFSWFPLSSGTFAKTHRTLRVASIRWLNLDNFVRQCSLTMRQAWQPQRYKRDDCVSVVEHCESCLFRIITITQSGDWGDSIEEHTVQVNC